MATDSQRYPTPVSSVKIPVAVAAVRNGEHISRHIEAQLDTAQARALKRIFTGLDETGARLANGRRITSNADVVRYILEQLPAE